jgi:hypothetical protein
MTLSATQPKTLPWQLLGHVFPAHCVFPFVHMLVMAFVVDVRSHPTTRQFLACTWRRFPLCSSV